MDINVEKFQKDVERFCKSHHNCTGCSLNELTYGCCSIDHLTEIIPVVQKWEEEHSDKTYLSDFKEKFPNMDISSSFYTHYCVERFYGFDKKPESCIRTDCEDCWNRVME